MASNSIKLVIDCEPVIEKLREQLAALDRVKDKGYAEEIAETAGKMDGIETCIDEINNAARIEIPPIINNMKIIGRIVPVPEKWIPCAERLPEDGLDVLVYLTAWNEHIQVAHIQYGGTMWELSDGEFYFSQYDVSHWMPLPEPPEVKNNG